MAGIIGKQCTEPYHHALGFLLHVRGGGPRLVYVLGGHVLEHGQVVPDEGALLVVLLAERHRAAPQGRGRVTVDALHDCWSAFSSFQIERQLGHLVSGE